MGNLFESKGMVFKELKIKGCYEIELEINSDERGSFSRVYCYDEFKKKNIDFEINQINFSYSRDKGQIRGLHFYSHPNEEYKMVKCIKGEIYDVVVDLRKNSPTYLQYESLILNEGNNKYILIPHFCAHGFQTLTENVEMIYFHSKKYLTEFDKGVVYNDKKINIKWPLHAVGISPKDLNLPNSINL